MATANDIVESVKQIRSQYKDYDKRNRSALVQNMVAMYWQMKASEDLLANAIEFTKDDWLKDYFKEHSEEERGHAQWIASDLETNGVDLKNTSVPIHVVEMVGSIYYLIRNYSSAALLGYMLVLEAFSAPIGVIEELEKIHGKSLMATIRYHSEHDPNHTEELLAVIDCVSEKDRDIVWQVAIQTATYMGRISADLHKYAIN